MRRAIIEAVADLLGPDLVLWRSNFFYMTGAPGTGLPWHQDDYAEIFKNNDTPKTNDMHLSVQLALSSAIKENCMVLIPGSHALSVEDLYRKHGLRFTMRNAGGSAQYHQENSNLNIYRIVLDQGEFVIFHPRMVHCSSATLTGVSTMPRLGLGLRFTTPAVRVSSKRKCVLVHGENKLNRINAADWTSKLIN